MCTQPLRGATNYLTTRLTRTYANDQLIAKLQRIANFSFFLISLTTFSALTSYVGFIRPKLNATWLRDRSSWISFPVHLAIVYAILGGFKVALDSIFEEVVKVKQKKEVELVNNMCSKLPTGPFRPSGKLFKNVVEFKKFEGLSNPVVLGETREEGRKFMIFLFTENGGDKKNFKLILYYGLTFSSPKIFNSNDVPERLANLSFENLMQRLEKIAKNEDEEYSLYKES